MWEKSKSEAENNKAKKINRKERDYVEKENSRKKH